MDTPPYGYFGDQPEGTKQFYRNRWLKLWMKQPRRSAVIPLPAEIEWNAALLWDQTQRQIRDAMQKAEEEGRLRGWDQKQIDKWVSCTIAATDPENSFFQEMEALTEQEIDDETRKAIFSTEYEAWFKDDIKVCDCPMDTLWSKGCQCGGT